MCSLFGLACEQKGRQFSLANTLNFAFEGLRLLTIKSNLKKKTISSDSKFY